MDIAVSKQNIVFPSNKVITVSIYIHIYTHKSTSLLRTKYFPAGWYLAAENENCDDACTAQDLECSEEGLKAHNADVDSSEEVLNLVQKLGGTP